MSTFEKSLTFVRRAVVPLAAAAAVIGLATPASAYVLYKTATCKPGLRWDTSRPVTVRLLADSVLDYLETQGRGLSGMTGFVNDVRAVVDLYNSVPGSRLVLEFGTGITGDRRLDGPSVDDFGAQTIVIGFTDQKLDGKSAEAWVSDDPEDGCTRTRAHIIFRDAFDWIYGPPDATDVNGRSFYTADQPPIPGNAPARTFLGILTHEMGHAIGLAHTDNDYAVMAQGFKTWFRGSNHVLHTRLLPDDTAGLLALYGTPGARKPLDISVSNTWYKSAQSQYTDACRAEIGRVNAAERAVKEAFDIPAGQQVPSELFFKSGEHADLIQALFDAQEALRGCEEDQNASQIVYCNASSRGDLWADRLADPLRFCGVNSPTGSSYRPVSSRICPGEPIQLRYTLNNHTSLRDVQVRSEVWFSRDKELNVRGGDDTKSPDVREFALKAADSATIGQMFRLPADQRSGDTLYIFVRAVPHDAETGASLWDRDIAPWNNALMLASHITADASACR